MGTGTATTAVASATPAASATPTGTLAAMAASTAATAAATAIIAIVWREATAAAARPTAGQGANTPSRMTRRGAAAAAGCEDT